MSKRTEWWQAKKPGKTRNEIPHLIVFIRLLSTGTFNKKATKDTEEPAWICDRIKDAEKLWFL